MQHQEVEEPVALEVVIERLASNNPRWDALFFDNLLINPALSPQFSNEVLMKLAEAFANNSTVKSLMMRNRTGLWQSDEWGREGARALAKALCSHSALEHVSLGLPYTHKEYLSLFLDCLRASYHIISLDILIYTDQLETISTALKANSSLTHIQIRGRQIELIEYEEIMLINFAFAITANKKIRSLALDSMPLGDIGLASLAYSFDATWLQYLDLINCGIRTASNIKEIIRLLKDNGRLRELNLSENPLTNGAVKVLVTLLPQLTCLEKLTLNNTRLRTNTLEYLVTAWLKHRFTIIHFEMERNYFDMDAIESILKLIEQADALEVLNMSYCGLGDAFIKKGRSVLANPGKCRLEELWFMGVQTITAKSQKYLISILAHNEHLCVLYPPSINELPKIHWAALERNQIKKMLRLQGQFIEALIKFSNIYFAQPKNKYKTHFSDLPYEIAFLILLECGCNTPEMNQGDLSEWASIIFENFRLRRKLIEAGEYDPYERLPQIDKWWSCTPRSNLTFFKEKPPSKKANISALMQRVCRVM